MGTLSAWTKKVNLSPKPTKETKSHVTNLRTCLALFLVPFASFCSKHGAPRPDRRQFTAARDETAGLTERIQTVEREIDERVYCLYGLTPDEIKIVEEATK